MKKEEVLPKTVADKRSREGIRIECNSDRNLVEKEYSKIKDKWHMIDASYNLYVLAYDEFDTVKSKIENPKTPIKELKKLKIHHEEYMAIETALCREMNYEPMEIAEVDENTDEVVTVVKPKKEDIPNLEKFWWWFSMELHKVTGSLHSIEQLRQKIVEGLSLERLLLLNIHYELGDLTTEEQYKKYREWATEKGYRKDWSIFKNDIRDPLVRDGFLDYKGWKDFGGRGGAFGKGRGKSVVHGKGSNPGKKFFLTGFGQKRCKKIFATKG